VPCRIRFAVPLVLALVSGCSSGSDGPSGPPSVPCSPATSRTLVVNAPPTCGSLPAVEYTTYWFTANATGTYTVTLWTMSGDADLDVGTGSASYHSWKSPPQWVDSVTFPITWAPLTPQITVNAPRAASTYAIQVTGP
jgi:hypothetical protein